MTSRHGRVIDVVDTMDGLSFSMRFRLRPSFPFSVHVITFGKGEFYYDLHNPGHKNNFISIPWPAASYYLDVFFDLERVPTGIDTIAVVLVRSVRVRKQ